MTITRLTLRLPGGISIELLSLHRPATVTGPTQFDPTLVETEGTELPSAQPMPLRSCRSNVLPFARRSA